MLSGTGAVHSSLYWAVQCPLLLQNGSRGDCNVLFSCAAVLPAHLVQDSRRQEIAECCLHVVLLFSSWPSRSIMGLDALPGFTDCIDDERSTVEFLSVG